MNITAALVQKGFSKYRIAKYCGVHWNTVDRWLKSVHAPKDSHVANLTAMLNQEPNSYAKNEALRKRVTNE